MPEPGCVVIRQHWTTDGRRVIDLCTCGECPAVWIRVGLDANGPVFVSNRDEHGMRRVRLGDGTEQTFNPGAVHLPWLNTLTHWDVDLVQVEP